jgi:RNA polymerase sigma-70 factor, ECF subfamily
VEGGGGAAAFEAVYVASADRLVTQLYLVTGDVEEARDCVQEGFARAWLRWDDLARTADDPVAWVYTVSYRVAVSRFRRRLARDRVVRRLVAPTDLPGPSAEAVAVRDALARLPHGQRAAIVLHYYEGLTVDVIAGILGVTPSAVKARLVRGRAAMQPWVRDGRTPPAGVPTAGVRP